MSNSSFHALTQAGATFTRTETSATSSFAINGIPIQSASSAGVRYAWTLPSDTGLHVVFSPESFGKTLVKIFKKELQVGDPMFDAAVYIDTDNKDAVAALLENEAVRNAVHRVASQDGRIAVDGSQVIYELVGDATDQDLTEMETFITALMN